MDMLWPVCAEPHSIDALHGNEGTPFEIGLRQFQRIGCEIFGIPHNDEGIGSFAAQAAMATYGMLGDDIDGAVSTFEDFGLI